MKQENFNNWIVKSTIVTIALVLVVAVAANMRMDQANASIFTDRRHGLLALTHLLQHPEITYT